MIFPPPFRDFVRAILLYYATAELLRVKSVKKCLCAKPPIVTTIDQLYVDCICIFFCLFLQLLSALAVCWFTLPWFWWLDSCTTLCIAFRAASGTGSQIIASPTTAPCTVCTAAFCVVSFLISVSSLFVKEWVGNCLKDDFALNCFDPQLQPIITAPSWFVFKTYIVISYIRLPLETTCMWLSYQG